MIHTRLFSPTPFLVRIVAHRIPWPDHTDRPNRSSLAVEWRCLTEEGLLLVEATPFPLWDSGAVLSNTYGLPGDTLITLRHSGKDFDSFIPMPLSVAAKPGIKRLEDAARLRELVDA